MSEDDPIDEGNRFALGPEIIETCVTYPSVVNSRGPKTLKIQYKNGAREKIEGLMNEIESVFQHVSDLMESMWH